MTDSRFILAAAVLSAAMMGPGAASAAVHPGQDTAFVKKAAQAGIAEVQLA